MILERLFGLVQLMKCDQNLFRPPPSPHPHPTSGNGGTLSLAWGPGNRIREPVLLRSAPGIPFTLSCTQHPQLICLKCSVADPDPGSVAFLTPGSGIRDEQPGSYFRELSNHCLGVKVLKCFDADPGTGMEKTRIRDRKNCCCSVVFSLPGRWVANTGYVRVMW
jgi:hypothetical protein